MTKFTKITLLIVSLMFITQKSEATYISFERESKVTEAPDLLLYYSPWCPFCQRVLSHLEKIKKTIPMKNLQNDREGRQDLISIGGKAQIPCLIINGEALYESQDIINWISKHKHLLESNQY